MLFCAASAVVALGESFSVVAEASLSVLLVTGSLLHMCRLGRGAHGPPAHVLGQLHGVSPLCMPVPTHLQHHAIGSSPACFHSPCTIHIRLPGAGRGAHHFEGHGGTPALEVFGSFKENLWQTYRVCKAVLCYREWSHSGMERGNEISGCCKESGRESTQGGKESNRGRSKLCLSLVH